MRVHASHAERYREQRASGRERKSLERTLRTASAQGTTPTPLLSLCVPASPEMPCSWTDGCRRKAGWQENRHARGRRKSTCERARFQNTCGEQGITARGGLSKGETNTIHYDIHRAGIPETGPQSRGEDAPEQGSGYFRPQNPPAKSHTLLWHVSIEEQDITKW